MNTAHIRQSRPYSGLVFQVKASYLKRISASSETNREGLVANGHDAAVLSLGDLGERVWEIHAVERVVPPSHHLMRDGAFLNRFQPLWFMDYGLWS